MSSKSSENIKNNDDVIYKRQSREEFLKKFRQFKALYVNNPQLNNEVSNRNKEIFKP